MKNAAPKAIAVQKAIDAVVRNDRGRLLAGLMSRLGDFQLAEDALQEALISALGHWGRSGIPHSPTAWLMRVSYRKAIDRIRAKTRENNKAENLGLVVENFSEDSDHEDIPDERLRMIFTCCHPALEEKSRVALTLRTVCNLTTREIAAVFLDTEKAMGQRLSRSKAKIKSKGISFAIPQQDQWPERLETVLSTIYLIFTTGYVRETVDERDLCHEGVFLIRLLNKLQPGDAEIEGALALLLLTESRRLARIAENGLTVPIEQQNRELWQTPLIAEARNVLETAMQRRQPGPYQIKAAIADCHMASSVPDWKQMALLYQSLWAFEPTPIIALNWAVVMAENGYTEQALTNLDGLQKDLAQFQPWHAARASLLSKLGRKAEAKEAYEIAIEKAPNLADRAFLEHKLIALSQ